jgi:hypothetical protein
LQLKFLRVLCVLCGNKTQLGADTGASLR